MKKILLSSIIMLAVCGAVNAQDATGSKVKKNNQATTTTAAATPALTPQKSSIAVQTNDLNTTPAPRSAADREAAAQAPTQIKTKNIQTQAAATAVNVDSVVMTDEEKEKALKAEQEKATGAKEKKNKQ